MSTHLYPLLYLDLKCFDVIFQIGLRYVLSLSILKLELNNLIIILVRNNVILGFCIIPAIIDHDNQAIK